MSATELALGLMGVFGSSLAIAAPARTQGTAYASIEKGRYLVNAGDCASCHTDVGGKPYAGGRAKSSTSAKVAVPQYCGKKA